MDKILRGRQDSLASQFQSHGHHFVYDDDMEWSIPASE